MALIVRYGTMKYDSSVIAVIGAGDYSTKEEFYVGVRKVNWHYKKKDFVDPADHNFGAFGVSRLLTDNKSPTGVFAQFAELDLRKVSSGSSLDKILLLEDRLKKQFGKSAKRHLVVEDQGSIVEVFPSKHFFWDRFGRDYEISSYLNGSFDEFVKGKK